MFNNGTFYQVQEILFSLRENPSLAAAFLDHIEKLYSKDRSVNDGKLLEFLTLLFFDNPMPDTSKSSDTNLQYYNILRAFNKLLEINSS